MKFCLRSCEWELQHCRNYEAKCSLLIVLHLLLFCTLQIFVVKLKIWTVLLLRLGLFLNFEQK